MSKTYLPYEPDQQLLLPAALQEWLPDDHLAYFISDVVDQLDMSEVTARYERERRGGPPYHPRMMVKVLLYGYCVGVASSRRIAQRLHEGIAFRVLAVGPTDRPSAKLDVALTMTAASRILVILRLTVGTAPKFIAPKYNDQRERPEKYARYKP